MDSTEAPERRRLTPSDMPSLMALVNMAGWNQTEQDWHRMLAIGRGTGFADERGRIVASAVTLYYAGKIGWIGMVLVARDWRRKGLATRLLVDCIRKVQSAGAVPALDATPEGEKVYSALGFAGTMMITRWRGKGHARPYTASRTDTLPDLEKIASLDARAFGADRRTLIKALLSDASVAVHARDAETFAFLRPGRTSDQIGPVLSRDTATAVDLVESIISDTDGPLLIDVPDRQSEMAELLEKNGFVRERGFRRMYMAEVDDLGDASLIHAIAGPELG